MHAIHNIDLSFHQMMNKVSYLCEISSFRWYVGASGLCFDAALQLQGPQFDPELRYKSGYCYVLPVSTWVLSKCSSFLPPPETVPVGEMTLL